jgi:hypothetical protein
MKSFKFLNATFTKNAESNEPDACIAEDENIF